MKGLRVRLGIGLLPVLAVTTLPVSLVAQSAAQKQPDAVAADPKHYSVEFENDIVRVLRVRIGAGESAPTNVGKAVAESIGVEFKNRQRAR